MCADITTSSFSVVAFPIRLKNHIIREEHYRLSTGLKQTLDLVVDPLGPVDLAGGRFACQDNTRQSSPVGQQPHSRLCAEISILATLTTGLAIVMAVDS